MSGGELTSTFGVFYSNDVQQEQKEAERLGLELGPSLQQSESETTVTAVVTEKYNCCTKGLPRWTYLNLYGLSLSFMFTFSAYYGLQGLQSSLNESIGVASVSVIYAFYFLCGFASTAIVRLLTTKYTLFFGYICFTIYTVANFYPRSYTLLPVSVLVGISIAPIWTSISTHLGMIALRFALSPGIKENYDTVITKFTGISFFALQMSQIIGSAASSLVLFPYNSFTNDSTFSQTSNVCNNTEAQNITPTQNYTLLSIFLAFNAVGIAVLLIFVSKIETTKSVSGKCKKYCSEPFIDLLRVLASWKMLLLGPLSLYNAATIAFSFSSYTKFVVSMCIGVGNIGWTLIVLGFFSAITSIIYAQMVKWFHRVPFAISAAFMNLFFFIFMAFFPRRPSYELAFLFAIFWGIGGGIWNTLSSSLVGILFPTLQDSAYSAFRMWYSVGYSFGFAIAEVGSFSDQNWIMIALCIASFACYLLLEVFISKWGHKTCCSRDLGVFDGPKSKYGKLSESSKHLTEEMINSNEHENNLHDSTTDSLLYNPPLISNIGGGQKRKKVSLVTKAGESSDSTIELPKKAEGDSVDSSSELSEQRAELLQSTAL